MCTEDRRRKGQTVKELFPETLKKLEAPESTATPRATSLYRPTTKSRRNARLVDKHLKKVYDEELARMTKDAAERTIPVVLI
jgi:hypothetical protein